MDFRNVLRKYNSGKLQNVFLHIKTNFAVINFEGREIKKVKISLKVK